MDQRKLIKLGNSSFAIALPKNWIDKSGLKKGDAIFITPNSTGELIVQPTLKKDGEEKEITVNIEGLEKEEEIARELISAYVKGFNLIIVVGEKNNLKLTKKIAKIFLNLEPIEESEKKVIFKDLLDIEDINIEKFIRRIDNNLKDMFVILSNILKDEKRIKKSSKELEEIDEDVTKFYFLIWRFMNLGVDNPSIQANFKLDPKSLVVYFWISYNLEQIGDELKRIARKIDKVKNKEFLKEIFSLISDNYNKSMKAFFDKDKNFAKEVISVKGKTIKLCEKLSNIGGCEIISEKLQRINENIHHNSKMVFYNL